MAEIASLELQMLNIWKDVLENDDIGYEDNFFEVGGNSLYAMALLERIEQDFNVEIAVADLFDCENVREIAAVVGKHKMKDEA